MNNFNAILGAALGLLLMLFVTTTVVSAGNMLSELYKFMAIVAIIAGFLYPKAGVYIFIVCTAYLDFFKRLLIISGNVNMLDLYYVLGIAPLLLLGVNSGLAVQIMFNKINANRLHLWMFVLALMYFSAQALVLQRSMGMGFGMFSELANRGAYVTLIWIIPVLFRNPKEIQSLIIFIFVCFVPVVGYLFYQSYFGIADWELDYLLSGLTLEVRQLNARIFRPFSTMNSAANLSTMMSIMVVVCLCPFKKKEWTLSDMFSPMRVLLVLVFGLGAFLTYSRGGWFCGLVGIIGVVCFRAAWSTLTIYMAGIMSVVGVILSSSWLLRNEKMTEWTVMLMGDTSSAQRSMALKLGTFTSRLISYENLMTKSEYWTPFGVLIGKGVNLRELRSGDYYMHDFLTELLLTFGYIPLSIIGLGGMFALYKMHQHLLSIRDPLIRKWALLGMGCSVGIAVGSLANPAQLRTFPIGAYFFIFIGIVASMLYDSHRDKLNKGIAR